jgi:hypothetical protein
MVIRAVTEAARVGQQIVDGDFTAGWNQVIAAIRTGNHYPGVLELGEIARDRVRQAQLALLAQH